MKDKISRLVDYCQGVYHNGDGRALYDLYLKDIESITPEELIQVENEQLKMGLSTREMLSFVDKLIHVFQKSLAKYALVSSPHFLIETLLKENAALKGHLEGFKSQMKTLQSMKKSTLLDFMRTVEQYDVHFQKLENLLFSQLEKEGEHFEGLKIMWALHDEIRALISTIIKSEQSPQELVVLIGKLYFQLYGSMMKQEMILFPVAVNKINEEAFNRMYAESFEYGFCYIKAPEKKMNNMKLGNLVHQNIDLDLLFTLLNTLPVDFTFIDEKDEVKFFNMPEDRLFPRSPSIIGRNVRNCHPPESVHVVERILEAFKSREKSEATFWLEVMGEQVYIYYVPIFIEDVYKGTLEVSQKITHFKNLKGEKRLLEWS